MLLGRVAWALFWASWCEHSPFSQREITVEANSTNSNSLFPEESSQLDKKQAPKIDFVGIGVSKAGTTWLTDRMEEHPEICMSEPKEICYFNEQSPFCLRRPGNPNFKKDLSWYMSHFQHCRGEKVAGEFSTMYLYDKEAPRKIKEVFPNAKIVACLRNPIDRAYSQYWMYKSFLKLEDRSFSDAIRQEKEYTDKGKYYEQLKRYYKFFSRDQILIVFFEDMKKNPEKELRRVFKFLGVNEEFAGRLATSKKSNASKITKSKAMMNTMGLATKTSRALRLGFILRFLKKIGLKNLMMRAGTKPFKYPEMKAEDREYLQEKLNPDIAELEKLLQKDLSSWQ